MNTHDKIELPFSDEAAAHMLPSDLKKFESGEHVAEAFSIAVGNPDETSQPLFTIDQVRAAIEADRKRRGEPVYQVNMKGNGWEDCTLDRYESAGRVIEQGAQRGWKRWERRVLWSAPQPADPDAATIADYEAVLSDHRRLVRELDVLLNGEEGAAKQASLCDIVAQVRREGIKTAEPVDKSKNLQGSPVDKSTKMQGQTTASAEPFGHVWRAIDTTAVIKLVGDPRIIDGMPVYAAPVAAQPAQETIPRHVGETPAVPHLRDRLSEAHDACLDTNCVDCRAILREVLRILDSGSQPAGAAHE